MSRLYYNNQVDLCSRTFWSESLLSKRPLKEESPPFERSLAGIGTRRNVSVNVVQNEYLFAWRCPETWLGLDFSSCSIEEIRIISTSLTFKCLIEHLFADFSYSWPLDTYLWKRMMQKNRKLIHTWFNIDKKHLLFTKRKCTKFPWSFTASRCSPRIAE